jgi:hypothetical protein
VRSAIEGQLPVTVARQGIYLIDIDSGMVHHLTPPPGLLSGLAESALCLLTPETRPRLITFAHAMPQK